MTFYYAIILMKSELYAAVQSYRDVMKKDYIE